MNADPNPPTTEADLACKVHNDVTRQCAMLIANAMASPVDAMIVLESITAVVLTVKFPDPVRRRAAADAVAESVIERIGETNSGVAYARNPTTSGLPFKLREIAAGRADRREVDAVLHQAADEIERLRAELQAAGEFITKWSADLAAHCLPFPTGHDA